MEEQKGKEEQKCDKEVRLHADLHITVNFLSSHLPRRIDHRNGIFMLKLDPLFSERHSVRHSCIHSDFDCFLQKTMKYDKNIFYSGKLGWIICRFMYLVYNKMRCVSKGEPKHRKCFDTA